MGKTIKKPLMVLPEIVLPFTLFNKGKVMMGKTIKKAVNGFARNSFAFHAF